METIMRKTNSESRNVFDSSRVVAVKDHRQLADSELHAVSGGRDSGAYRGRYQLQLAEANNLLSARR
jgi:hypothetical protein